MGGSAFCATEQAICVTKYLVPRVCWALYRELKSWGEGKSGAWVAAWRGLSGSQPTLVSLSGSPLIAFLLPQSSGSPALTRVRVPWTPVSTGCWAPLPGCLMWCLKGRA